MYPHDTMESTERSNKSIHTIVLMKKYTNMHLGLFLVRFALAAVFIGHGIQKFSNLEGTIGFFGKLGLPSFFAYLVATVETAGGILMLLGVGTQIAGVLLAIVMLVAILKVKVSSGFVGGYEFEATLLLTSLGIAFTGPGSWKVGMKQPMMMGEEKMM
jgi:uncharacterized membrane protein YphA (DoxX/SURF4 family)